MISSENSGKLLFNSSSLSNLLGSTKSKKRKSGKTPNEKKLIDSILRSETGIIDIRKIKKTQATKSSASKNNAFSSADPYASVRATYLAQNNAFAFGTSMDLNGDDVLYLERQFSAVRGIIVNLHERLYSAYQNLVAVEGKEEGMITSADAHWLLQCVGVDTHGAEIAWAEETEDNEREPCNIHFETWCTEIEARERVRLLGGVLAERRRLVGPLYLDSQSYGRNIGSRGKTPEMKVVDMTGTFDEFDEAGGTSQLDASSTLSVLDFITTDIQTKARKNSLNESQKRSRTFAMAGSSQSMLLANGGNNLPPKKSKGKHARNNNSRMLGVSDNQPSTIGDDELGALPAIQMKNSRVLNAGSTFGNGGYDESFGRATPRCLKTSLHENTRKFSGYEGFVDKSAAIEELRRELEVAQQGVSQLDSMVENNIAWVHSNCDTSVLGTGMSGRAKQTCQKISLDRMFGTIAGHLRITQHWAMQRWFMAAKCVSMSQLARTYSRAKGLEIINRVMFDAVRRQHLCAWGPWIALYRQQRRWEQEAACMEIQRCIRGKLGRLRFEFIKVQKNAVRIQCLFRKKHANTSVDRKKKMMELKKQEEAAAVMQNLFISRAKIAEAKRLTEEKRQAKRLAVMPQRADSIKSATSVASVRSAAAQSYHSTSKKGASDSESTDSEDDRPVQVAKHRPAKPKTPSTPSKKLPSPAKKLSPPPKDSKPTSPLGKAPTQAHMNKEISGRQPAKGKAAPLSKSSRQTRAAKQENSSRTKLKGTPGKKAGSKPSTPHSKGTEGKELTATSPVGTAESGVSRAVASPPLVISDATANPPVSANRTSKPAVHAAPKEKPSSSRGASRKQSPRAAQASKSTTPITVPPEDIVDVEPRLPTPMEIEAEVVPAVARMSDSLTIEGTAEAATIATPVAYKPTEDDDISAVTDPALSRMQSRPVSIGGSLPISRPVSAVDVVPQPSQEPAPAEKPKTPEVSKPATPAPMVEPEPVVEASPSRPQSSGMLGSLIPSLSFRKSRPPSSARSETPDTTEKPHSKPSTPDRPPTLAAAGKMLSSKMSNMFGSRPNSADAKDVEIAPRPTSSKPVLETIVSQSVLPIDNAEVTPIPVVKPQTPQTKPQSPVEAKPQTPEVNKPETPQRPISATSLPAEPTNKPMSPFSNWFGGGKKKTTETPPASPPAPVVPVAEAPHTPEAVSKPEFIRPEISPDTAVGRIQRGVLTRQAMKKTQHKRDELIRVQEDIAHYIVWAVICIQRVVRGRLGRIRWGAFKFAQGRDFQAKKVKCATRIQAETRAMLAKKRVKKLARERQRARNKLEWRKSSKKGEVSTPVTVAPAATGTTSTVDSEQVKQLDDRLKKLELMENAVNEREAKLADESRLALERAAAVEQQLKEFQAKALADAAERAVKDQMLLDMAAGPISDRTEFNKNTGRGSQKNTGRSARGSARDSARSLPSARSARGGAAINSKTIILRYKGEEWAKLWDAEEGSFYWYNKITRAAQWGQPGEEEDGSGYESGAMTDHSSGNESGGEWDGDWEGNTGSGKRGGGNSFWQEFWDESAQSKYWYNYSTGEATWSKPDDIMSSVGSVAGVGGPSSSRSLPPDSGRGNGDWMSYIDDATGQEYWYNSVTGETSWA